LPFFKDSDRALLLWVVANVIAIGASACSTATGFAVALFFHAFLRGGKDSGGRGFACKEARDGKRHSEDHFSHVSSPFEKSITIGS
jgi:hypothetical protein